MPSLQDTTVPTVRNQALVFGFLQRNEGADQRDILTQLTQENSIFQQWVYFTSPESREVAGQRGTGIQTSQEQDYGKFVSPSHIFPLFFLCFFSFPFCFFPFFSLTSNFNFSVSKLRNLVIDSSKVLVSFWRAKILMLNSKFPREENSLT